MCTTLVKVAGDKLYVPNMFDNAWDMYKPGVGYMRTVPEVPADAVEDDAEVLPEYEFTYNGVTYKFITHVDDIW